MFCNCLCAADLCLSQFQAMQQKMASWSSLFLSPLSCIFQHCSGFKAVKEQTACSASWTHCQLTWDSLMSPADCVPQSWMLLILTPTSFDCKIPMLAWKLSQFDIEIVDGTWIRKPKMALRTSKCNFGLFQTSFSLWTSVKCFCEI